MYYKIKWMDGRITRFFTWNKKEVNDLIWDFDVVSVWVDDNQDD